MMKLGTMILALLLAGFAGPGMVASAVAQEVVKVDPDAVEAPKITVLPPAYDNQMMRLAEILGALHYLRELCGAKEEQLWRDEMKNLIEQEEPTVERRAMLTARFNRGFRGYREIYRTCTAAAIEANKRYLRQGTRLAGEIPNRYGR